MKNTILILLCLLYSCSHYPPDIEAVLKQAGTNRPELESVLVHYKTAGDRQKLEAAKFLIRNMPYHQHAVSNVDDFRWRVGYQPRRCD